MEIPDSSRDGYLSVLTCSWEVNRPPTLALTLTLPLSIIIIITMSFRWCYLAHADKDSETVMLIELTSPWEENLTKKHFETIYKYNKLDLTCKKESTIRVK